MYHRSHSTIKRQFSHATDITSSMWSVFFYFRLSYMCGVTLFKITVKWFTPDRYSCWLLMLILFQINFVISTHGYSQKDSITNARLNCKNVYLKCRANFILMITQCKMLDPMTVGYWLHSNCFIVLEIQYREFKRRI